MQKASELEQKLQNFKGSALIVDHVRSDPDSIASKFAFSHILKEHFNIPSTIAYSKAAGHPQNDYMIKLFEEAYGLQLPQVETLDISQYQLIALLDTNFTASNLPFTEEQLAEVKTKKTIIIDHHKQNQNHAVEISPFFEDSAESGVSATATRITEYMINYNLQLRKKQPIEQLLATALTYGIEIDSSNRPKNKRDYEAIIYLLEACDQQMKKKISRCGWDAETMQRLGKTISNFKIEDSKFLGSYAIGCIGNVSQDIRHIVAEVSETLLEIDSVNAAIGIAVADGQTVEISIRTKESCNAKAEEIAERFGGGGRDGSAGASITYNKMLDKLERIFGKAAMDQFDISIPMEDLCTNYVKMMLRDF